MRIGFIGISNSIDTQARYTRENALLSRHVHRVTYVYVHAFSERASTNKGGWVGVVCAPRWERARE